jgi:putative ABC transport system permease protein
MDTLRQDIRLGLRGLTRHPGFALTVILTMALGIGANAAIFSVVHGVALSALPYDHGERMVVVRQQRPLAGIQNQGFSPLEVADYRTQSTTLDQVLEYHSMWFILLGRGEPERVQTGVVSANFFDAMGVRPAAGRTFRPDDDKPGADAVLMLSHGYWKSRFGGDPGVVGQVFEMNDRPHTVIGVLPAIPQYPQENDVYMPVSACPFRSAQATIDNRNARMVQVFGRLKPNVRHAEHASDVALVASRLQQTYPESYPASSGYTAASFPLRDELTRGFRPTLQVLAGAAAFVLLIVCASVANLLVARLVKREREMAIRAALGAGRWRLLRQLLTESTVLAVLGGVVGVALATVSLDLLTAFADRFTTRAEEIALSAPVLIFTFVVAVLTGIVVGAIPALPARADVASTMQEGGRTVSGGRLSIRNALIVGQVAISFMLLISAGLMLRSMLRLHAVDPGIRTDSVLTMRVALNFTKYANAGQIRQFHAALLERLRSIPDVRSLGAASTFPLNQGGGFLTGVRIEGQAETEVARLPRVEVNAASPGYFQTIGIPLIKGRLFTDQDAQTSAAVGLVSQSMARHVFADRDPIGLRITNNNGNTWTTIVGVVGDVRRSLDAAPSDALYVPLAQTSPLTAMFLMRTTGDVPPGLERQAREAVYAIDPNQPVDQFRTLDAVRAESIQAQRLTAILIGVFAALALSITAAGLAGVIAFSVNQRTQEFGLRMALGASSGSLLRMVLGQALRLVAIGLGLGIVGAVVFGQVIRTLLFSVEPTDVATFVLVAAGFLAIAVLACFVPARRAATVDPMIALRS